MHRIKNIFFVFCLWPMVVGAECNIRGTADDAPTLCGYATQGGMLYGEIKGWDVYRIDDGNEKTKISRDGVFVVGRGRDAPPELKLEFCKAKNCQTYTYKIKQRKYIEQKVNVPDKYMKYPDDVQKRIDRDNALIVRGRADSMNDDTLDFMEIKSPLDLSKYRISSVYGSARVFNGVPKSPHRGIDIAAPNGTPIYASAAGRVVIVSDMYMSGNTVFIAHGHGVTTAYLHMDRMDVKNGQMVKAGDVIGIVGSTGRSSGAHLHFGVYWDQVALDPELFIK